MFQPESDWTGQGRLVEHFSIDHSMKRGDVDIDIRRFRWSQVHSGEFSPAKHYLDFSLAAQSRSSLLKADEWSDKRFAGDILFLPAGRPYQGHPAAEERKLLCVAFGSGFLENVFEDDRSAGRMLATTDIRNAWLRRMLGALAAEVASPGFASDILVEATLVGIIVELARHAQLQQRDERCASASTRQVRSITDFVMANLSHQLTAADVARQCGVSVRHLGRIFKVATGTSLGDYVARSRIELAKELLVSDEFRVKEISWRCGFQSTSSFSAAFRTATGKTPSEFREGSDRLQ
jgi:AraC family transcriptional regulator